MRWKNIARLTALLLATATIAIGGKPFATHLQSALEHRAQLPDPVNATPEEARAILVAVLAKADFMGIPPPPPRAGELSLPPKRVLLLRDMSSTFRDDDILGVDFDSFISLKMRQELLLANKVPRIVQNPNVPGVRYVSSQAIQAIFKTGFWNEFYRAYPGTAGFSGISIPVLSKDRQQALVYFEQFCDGLCGKGSLHLLVKTSNGWEDIGQQLIWIS